MTKKQKTAALAKLKLLYGDRRIPVVGDLLLDDKGRITLGNQDIINDIATLAEKGYLEYRYDKVEDDEGVPHIFERGYELSHKAKQLLEEAAK